MFQGYVINLDSRPDRMAKFNQQSAAKYFHRCSAIDKAAIERVGVERIFDLAKGKELASRPVAFGEMGCTLSHLGCWNLIAQNQQLNDDDFAIVAEDDVTFMPNFENLIPVLMDYLKDAHPTADLIILQKLGLRTEKLPTATEDTQEFRYVYPKQKEECDSDGSSLYLIRKSRAKKLMMEAMERKPFWLADDFSIFCPLENIMILLPLLGVVENNADSDLELERNAVRALREAHVLELK
ncbi:hypothetical protein A4G18_03765 [Pasteurellaceae bacterium Pebbles2]|nr:hypothetical protein [Pasteurellaceae bacterium Pebbles2]